ncbi:MAG TPA: hypothetical protein VK859_14115 [bacterium]|jgi:hypothetical protein|nr:hypothetical protein [bacterium]
MKSKHVILVMAGLVVLSFARLSYSQPAVDNSPKAKPTEIIRLTRREIIKRLQLTDDQHKLLQQHRAAYRKSIAVLDGQLKVKEVDLENELEKSDPDQDKLDLIVQNIGELKGQRLGVQVKAKLELEKKILTPQQVDLLKSLEGKESSTTDDNL